MKISDNFNKKRRPLLPQLVIILAILAGSVFVWLTISGRTTQTEDFSLTAEEQEWLENNAEDVVFAPTPYYPPLDFIDEDGNHRGLAGDLLSLLEDKIGYEFKRKRFDSWSEIETAARQKEIGGAPLVHHIPERDEYWEFTEPYVEIPTIVIGRENQEPVAGLEDLIGQEVAVVEDYAIISLLKKDYPRLELREISSDLEGLQRLSLGEFDALLVDFPVARHLIEKAEIPNLQILGQSGYSYSYRFAVRKDWPRLARILDKAILSVEKEGKIEELKSKWLPGLEPLEKPFPWKIILIVFVLLTGAIVFFGFWIWLLRRTVENKTAQLKESKRQLSTLINNIPGGIVYRCKNKPGWPMEIIRGDCREITGYSSSEIRKKEVSWGHDIIFPEDKEKVHNKVQKALREKKQFAITHRIKTRGGEIRWVTDRGQGIYDSSGDLQAIEGFIADITHQKEIETKLNKSLQEKETLLHEIHHRVKNNLFTIISYLSLQKNQYGEEMADCLQDAINRVQTMALIHKQIYENSDLSNLNFARLIKKISTSLIETYQQPDQEIKSTFELEDIFLTPEQAIPCSLAVTELISNSIYHGIGEQEEGSLKVTLKKLNSGKVKLTITDNGSGLPENFELKNNASMGLTIARKLVENQLGGSLQISSGKEGKTSSYIIFPLAENDNNSEPDRN